MTKIRYVALAVALLALVNSGCSSKKDSTARKAAFAQKITVLQSNGLDVNRTVDTQDSTHYTVTVKDAGKATMALLYLTHQVTISPRDKAKIEKLLLNLKQAKIEVDWKKYADNQPQSVYVWLVGSGKESPAIQKFLKAKKLGMYLSYDADDLLKQVDIKDIDDTFAKADGQTHVKLQGVHLAIAKAATEDSPSSKMDFQGGTLSITSEESKNKKEVFSYQNFNCQIDQSNAYLGTWDCLVPVVSFTTSGTGARNAGTLTVNNTKMHYVSSEESSKVKSDGIFQIDSIAFKSAAQAKEKTTFDLKNLKLDMSTNNFDAALIKSLYALARKPQADLNASIAATMKLVGKMFANGASLDYDFSLDSVDFASGKTKQFSLKAFEEKGNITFEDTIKSHDISKVKNISVVAGTDHFQVKNIIWESGLEGLYNLVPDFMQFAAMTAQHDPSVSLTKEESDLMASIGTKIVQSGFKLNYGPISVDSVDIKNDSMQTSYDHMQVDINATLAKNTIDMKNPMGSMMLLGYLHADGKIVLNKADLEKMAKDFSPKMMAMAMMLAKFEGDKAVFDLKFEKGHFTVNGKPIM